MLPAILAKNVPLSVQVSPFLFAKRSWAMAFDLAEQLGFKPVPAASHSTRTIKISAHRPVARALNFSSTDTEAVELERPIFSASPIAVKKKRMRKQKTPVVQPAVRRFTRSTLKLDGYRPKPVTEDHVRPKKRSRAKSLLQGDDIGNGPEPSDSEHFEPAENESNEFEKIEIPPTPIKVMQAVGIKLGMDPSVLTKEQLEAEPASTSSSSSNE
jgi:hypothetical protein